MFNFQGFINFELFEKWCHQESNFFKNLFVICWHSAFFYILKLLKPLNQP